MTFLNPWAFVFVLVFVWIFRPLLFSKKSLKDEEFINEHKRYYIQTKFILLSLFFTLLALSRPAITNELSKEKFDANEYIIALDASYSMQMDDLKPTRYELAKQNIISLLHLDTQDRFSLFAFTANPLLICPPTSDKAIAISALNSLEPKYILTKSTSLSSLIQRVATLDQEHKSLIIFTDGGDEHDITSLLKIATSSAITLNIIGVSSSKGAVITKDSKPYKNEQSHLVISRINPVLKDLAHKSGGFYFELDSDDKDLSSVIYKKMQEQNLDVKEMRVEVVSYKELYFIPLSLAFIILLISLTRVQKYLPFFVLLLLVMPNFKAQASLFDFHYVKVAKEAYEKGEYIKAQKYFKKLTPSQYSYMSLANAYYKNRQYKYSLRYYSQIKSKNPKIKSIVFYNMANAAFHLKKYQRAEELYKQSLNLLYSQEAYENLIILYKLGKTSKVNVADMLPTADSKKVKNITKKIDNKKEDEENSASSSSGKQRDAQGTQGGAGSQSKEKNKKSATIKGEKNKFKMGYNAYELINKGYVNEKHPW